MPVTFVIRFNVKPEERERFLSLLEGVLDTMRGEPMFHEATLHRDPDDEHRFMLYETWEDLDDVVNVQLQRPYRRAWHEALPEVLVAPRDIEVWRPLRTDRRAATPDRVEEPRSSPTMRPPVGPAGENPHAGAPAATPHRCAGRRA